MVLSGLLIDSISVTGLYQVHVDVDSRVFGIVLTFQQCAAWVVPKQLLFIGH